MERIAVTGASGYIGRRLIDHIVADPAVEKVLALDIRALEHPSPRVTFVRHDVTAPMGALFRQHGIQAAAHLAFILDPVHDRERERRVNLGGTENFCKACAAAGVEAMLIAASGTGYGAWPDNPVPLTEEDPLRGRPGFPYVEDKVAQERMADAFAAAHPETRVLRTRATLVLGPHVDNFVSRYFRRPVAFVVRGYNPPAPVVHEEDVAAATWKLLREAPAGAYNLDAPDPIRLKEALAITGRPVLALPAAIMYPLVRVGWRLRLKALTEAPPAMLDYLRYPWSCDGSRVTRVTDFRYRYDARATVVDFARHLSPGSNRKIDAAG